MFPANNKNETIIKTCVHIICNYYCVPLFHLSTNICVLCFVVVSICIRHLCWSAGARRYKSKRKNWSFRKSSIFSLSPASIPQLLKKKKERKLQHFFCIAVYYNNFFRLQIRQRNQKNSRVSLSGGWYDIIFRKQSNINFFFKCAKITKHTTTCCCSPLSCIFSVVVFIS